MSVHRFYLFKLSQIHISSCLIAVAFYPEDADFSDVRFLTKFSAENLDPSLCTYINHPQRKYPEFDFGTNLTKRHGYALWLTYEFQSTIQISLQDDKNISKVCQESNLFRLPANTRRQFPLLKLILSVGGENRTHDFSDTATVQGMEVFAASIAAKLRGWGLDGVDVYWDWEASPFRGDEILLLVLLQVIHLEK
ncbi:hypothetical protein BV898_17063 [Hypsibius exemplaris]|uniref:GH18 domain-containing protein n=1 Tax=Hypsibius exemplaris TaxID=2072580 RepID=A0A9X6NEV6_HYPEX|nr:hypothetical protein BV898_17063 [Hypsibius exemplaris]